MGRKAGLVLESTWHGLGRIERWVIEQVASRLEFGQRSYGRLKTKDDRNFAIEAVQERIDEAVYGILCWKQLIDLIEELKAELEQVKIERQNLAEALAKAESAGDPTTENEITRHGAGSPAVLGDK
jgi:hypothetical protein